MSSGREKVRSPVEDSSLDKDARELHKALSRLVRVYQFRDRKRICYYDISVTQCYALSAIIRNGSMTLNRLAQEMYLDKSTASRVVDSLERKGYARRSADSKDARALSLTVTKEGLKLHSQIEEDLITEMKKLAAGIDPHIRQATAGLIARLAKAATDRFSSTSIEVQD